jgi:GH18 family chitinase
VLGYLASQKDWIAGVNAIDLSAITDLNLAFINPDSTGHFIVNSDLNTAVEQAHAHHVRVFASIGGGSPPLWLASLLTQAARPAFIHNILMLADTFHLDGIDVDIENELINDQYAAFVYDLASAIKPKKKLLTAALASWNGDLIHDSTLRQYDFINIMSYDKTGPWDTTRPGQHAPMAMVRDDFNYFTRKRNRSPGTLLIGLPFYGYGFGPGAAFSLTYKQIAGLYPGAESKDDMPTGSGATIYYNGMTTIKQKTLFAKQHKAAGVMIWQLLGDTTGTLSLLKTIHDVQ